MATLHADALVVQADPYFNNTRGRLIALAARYAIPRSTSGAPLSLKVA
jgi:hypothetical protein